MDKRTFLYELGVMKSEFRTAWEVNHFFYDADMKIGLFDFLPGCADIGALEYYVSKKIELLENRKAEDGPRLGMVIKLKELEELLRADNKSPRDYDRILRYALMLAVHCGVNSSLSVPRMFIQAVTIVSRFLYQPSRASARKWDAAKQYLWEELTDAVGGRMDLKHFLEFIRILAGCMIYDLPDGNEDTLAQLFETAEKVVSNLEEESDMPRKRYGTGSGSGSGTGKEEKTQASAAGDTGRSDPPDISDFSSVVSYIKRFVMDQDEVVERIALIIVYYCRLVKKGEGLLAPECILLNGPTGSGKSLIFQVISSLPGLNVYVVNGATLTEEGFKGKNWSAELDKIRDLPEPKVIFIDEFDKKLQPSYSSYGQNVNEAVQHSLLAFLSGDTDVRVPVFLAGAFSSIRDKKKEDRNRKPAGFTKGGTSETPVTAQEMMVDREDMRKMGMISELSGRLQILNLKAPDRKTMEKVLLESPISPITVSREKAAEFGVRLKYTSGFVKEALDYAEKSELGVRSLNTVVDETASKAIIQCLKLGNEQIMIRHLDLSSEAAGKAGSAEPDSGDAEEAARSRLRRRGLLGQGGDGNYVA
ncbi:MAG: AAA family ATPase [Lachnospiraceae bacterium]|nr:AAA family ATPase [Lachnospiraceae bacterium]